MADSSPFDRGHTEGKRSVMLFGVDVSQTPFRKTVSMSNLSQYEQTLDFPSDVTAGYASDDIHPTEGDRERKKRGVPWTEKEHRLFLAGLHKVGKGDWRGISRNFVKTRTPTQVASHAQKYFLRRTNLNRRRRRSSLFDITTDSMEGEITTENSCPPPVDPNLVLFPVTTPLPSILIPAEKNNKNPEIFRPISTFPSPPPQEAEKELDLNSNPGATIDSSLLSLKLSSPENPQNSSRHSAFQTMSSSRGSSSGITVP